MYNTCWLYACFTAMYIFSMYSPIEEVNEELEILEQQSVAAADDNDDETSAVDMAITPSPNDEHDEEKDDREILKAKDVEVSEDENEVTSPLAVGDDVEANDCAILRSILSDGRYNISAEDRSALDSVIVTLYGGSM